MKKINIMPKLKELIEAPFKDKYALTQFIIDKQLREQGQLWRPKDFDKIVEILR